ncbi:MAG: hypothetical protein F6K14_32140 [Symploca sp. SIO2C1]|nr:hypothetical protein [Symploca sp. SIO2C1]
MIKTNDNDSVVINASIYDEITDNLITEELPIDNQGINELITKDNEPVVQTIIQQQDTKRLVTEGHDSLVVKAPIYDEITGKLIIQEASITNEGRMGLVTEDNDFLGQTVLPQQSNREIGNEGDELIMVKAPIYDEITEDLLTQEG